MSILLCEGNKSECCCCGGHINDEPVPGSSPSLRYCSIQCHDDWEDLLAQEAEQQLRAKS